MDEGGEERASGGRPGLPFDPLVGARVLGEIQAEGLRAAGALVDRIVHLVDGPAPHPSGEAASGSEADAGAAADTWFQMWFDLFQRSARAWGAASEPGGPVELDVHHGAGGADAVTVRVAPGEQVTTEVWLHNGTPEDVGSLVPRCSPLAASDGRTLDAEVAFDPPKVDQLLGRSSRGLVLGVAPGSDAAPGRYRGTVQVDGAPAVWLPIEVVVE